MNDALAGETPTDPVHGYKVGLLCYLGDGCIRLSGVGGPRDGQVGDRLYDVDDVARCARGLDHLAPDEACTCGFWSVVDRTDLGRAFKRLDQTWADLEIESFGQMVVHEYGLRSQCQRVLAVTLDDRCVECGRTATLLCADKPGPLTPRCQMHAASKSTGYCETANETAGRLGTEVRITRRMWSVEKASVERRPRSVPRIVRIVRIVRIAAVASIGLLLVVLLVRTSDSSLTSASGVAPPASLVLVPAGNIAATAQRAVGGETLSGSIDIAGQHSAVYRIESDGQVAGIAVLSVEPNKELSCSIAVREPVSAFVAALLPESVLIGEWRVGQAAGASAKTCLDWHDDIERVMSRTQGR